MKQLGNTNIKVTPIGFGVLTIGKTQLDYPVGKGADLIRYALEKGINFLDTAQYYDTYHFIREALKGGVYTPVISSKSLKPSYREMKDAVEEARADMDRDVIDVFLLHEVAGAYDWEMRRPAWEYLNEAKAKGLVKSIGVSTHHTDTAQMCADIDEIDVLFPLINYKSLGVRTGDGPGTKEDMAEAIKGNADAGKGVFAMKVFGGGNLTGGYLEALDYVTGLPGVDSVMIGFGHTCEVDKAIEYITGTIDRNYVPDTREKKMRIDAGDCTGCKACLVRCPNRAVYATVNPDGVEICDIDHKNCLTCGYCGPVCPVRALIMY